MAFSGETWRAGGGKKVRRWRESFGDETRRWREKTLIAKVGFEIQITSQAPGNVRRRREENSQIEGSYQAVRGKNPRRRRESGSQFEGIYLL